MSIGAEIERLEGAIHLSNLGRGTQLFVPGDPCDRVFVLLSGRVKLDVQGPGGKHCILHVVEAGEVFGESALAGETEHRAAAEVVERAAVVIAPTTAVEDLLEKRPGLWAEITPLLVRRLKNLEEQLQWVSFLEVEQRIARLLIRWSHGHGGNGDHGGNDDQEVRLSQRDLAGLIGATRETTSSALNRLQREGCLEIRRRCVVIRSLPLLGQHAGEVHGDSMARVHTAAS